MEPYHGALFSTLIVILFALLTLLRSVFPDASRRAETIVVGITTALFFGLCEVFLRH
jgi:hypothetical protein